MLEHGSEHDLSLTQAASLMVYEPVTSALNNVTTLDHIVNFNAPIIVMVMTLVLPRPNLILPHPFFL